MWYVYVDFIVTGDSAGNVIYVGKGTKDRINLNERNDKFNHVSRVYGTYRQVIMSTRFERYAYEIESEKIKEFHTFIDDPEATRYACNFDTGGVGGTQQSLKTCQKRSLSMMGTQNTKGMKFPNRKCSVPYSKERKLAQSIRQTGKPTAKRGQAPWNKGKKIGPISAETSRKIGDYQRGKKKDPVSIAKRTLSRKIRRTEREM